MLRSKCETISLESCCFATLVRGRYNTGSTLNIQAGLMVFGAAGEGIEGADVAAAVGPRHVLHGDG